jgi:glutathionylspermidine synthase
MLVLRDLLEKSGCETVLGSPRHLRHRFGRFTVDGSEISGAIRFYPGEWFGLLENRRAWSAAAARLPMMNPLCRLIAQSKSVFALWDLPGMVDASDLDFLHEVAPRTEFFRPAAAASLAEDPARWVLKQNFGRMGENVVMGSLVRPEEWQETLRHACSRPGDYVAQECFATRPLPFADGVMYPAIGAFLINGRFAGYYSRVAPTPFLTHQATYVPTVVGSEASAPVDSADTDSAHHCAV